MYKGSCLCGSITYTIKQELSDFGYCHCRSCQKSSGSAFGANAGINRSAIELNAKDHCLKEYTSTSGKTRAFCGRCGSPIYAFNAASPDILRIRLGSLDSAFNKFCKAHSFVAEKASWEVIAGDIPQFDQWADSKVLTLLGSKQPQ